MIVCNHCDLTLSDPAHCMFYCLNSNKQIPMETCMHCSSRLYRYKDFDIGDFFFDTRTKHYGIKLSSCRAFDLDHNCVYGFAGNHANDSGDFAYHKCNYEVW